jgi:hypothetical protein
MQKQQELRLCGVQNAKQEVDGFPYWILVVQAIVKKQITLS